MFCHFCESVFKIKPSIWFLPWGHVIEGILNSKYHLIFLQLVEIWVSFFNLENPRFSEHSILPFKYAFPEFLCLLLPWWPRQWRICLKCRRSRFGLWVEKIPWKREWLPSPIFFPAEFHGQRSLVGFMGSQRVRHDWVTNTHWVFKHLIKCELISINSFYWQSASKFPCPMSQVH